MKRVNANERELVVKILAESFDDNKSVNYVVRQDRKRKRRINALMDYTFNQCLAFGEVWLSDDRNGCALILLPDKKQFSLQSLVWDANLAFSSIGLDRVFTVLDREKRIKSYHPREPLCYLWFIGVNPEFQNKGIGSRLLQEVVDECEKKKRPIYLETSVERNLSWYKRFGFEVFQTIDLSYKLYILRRNVNSKGGSQ